MHAVGGVHRACHDQRQFIDHVPLAVGESAQWPLGVELRSEQRPCDTDHNDWRSLANDRVAAIDKNRDFIGTPWIPCTMLILEREDARTGNTVDDGADDADAQSRNVVEEEGERVGPEPNRRGAGFWMKILTVCPKGHGERDDSSQSSNGIVSCHTACSLDRLLYRRVVQ